MQRPKCAIFDLDGTLVDTMPLHWGAFRDVSRQFRIAIDEQRFYSLGGIPTLRIVEMLAEEQGLDIDAAEFRDLKDQEFHSNLHRLELIEPVASLARRWKQEIPIAVATGSRRDSARLVMDEAGISDWFRAVVCIEDVSRPKPYPDTFLEAARSMGMAPEDCVVFEDAPAGLKGAQDAGMNTVDVRELRN